MQQRTILIFILSVLLSNCIFGFNHEADVVVYGGTSGGVIAAVAAARENCSVIIVEETGHLGGMTSSGLGHVDIARPETLGGLTLEYFKSVRSKYSPNAPLFRITPGKAEEVFDEMCAGYSGIKVLRNQRLHEPREKSAIIENGKIKSIILESGDTVSGKIFIDATYEGDLLPVAGISNFLGREGKNRYNESAAGACIPQQLPYAKIFDDHGNVLPDLILSDHLPAGGEDKLTQSFNFRLCMTTDPDNKRIIEKPANYNPLYYQNLLNYLLTQPDKQWRFNDIISYWFFLPEGNKVDVNNRGINSTDFINHSHSWANASYSEREAIFQHHKDYTQGMFYFLAHDPRVPESLRTDSAKWGLAADEFTDNDNWPYRLYVREGRRMVGEYVMTQSDAFENNLKNDSIGLGSYMLDVHWVRKYATPDGKVFAEGLLGIGRQPLPVRPYEIPYRALLPKQEECTNFLAVVPLSASHVIYSSLRMEPVFMTVGEAAGIAAALAVKDNIPVQKINISLLQNKLKNYGGIINYPGRNLLFPRSCEIEDSLIMDDADANKTGTWYHAESGTPMLDGGYSYAPPGIANIAEYIFNISTPGLYRLSVIIPQHHKTSIKLKLSGCGINSETTYQPGHDTNVPEAVINTYELKAGTLIITLSGETEQHSAVADGIRLQLLN